MIQSKINNNRRKKAFNKVKATKFEISEEKSGEIVAEKKTEELPKIDAEKNDNEPQTKNNNETKEDKDNEKKDVKKFNNNNNNNRRNKNNKKNKKSFYDRVAKKRIDEGKIMLSQKVETKIYKLKKALKKKGVAEEEIRDIIRKKRREEELKYRKEQKTLCFKCRKPGHTLIECPEATNRDESHDICYFCGSAEHKLHECSKHKQAGKKNINLPFVKCFICAKTGHLTRDCKDNEKGAFPKGGKCILCGSVNHLVKNCPREGEKMKEIEINLSTYDDLGGGVDADDFGFDLPVNGNKNNSTIGSKKAKIVNF